MISIIVPIYNAEKTLRRCLDSILLQSYDNIEIIAVDDGSTDNSLQLVSTYAQHDNRLTILHKNNDGVSSARNMGLNASSGEYICFVDSDDELPQAALKTLVEKMEDGVDLVMGGYEIYSENGDLSYSISERSNQILQREDGITQMYRPSFYYYQGFICSKLFKRSIIRENHISFDEDIKFTEDRLFITKYIAAQKGKISFFSAPVYKYIERTNSAMASTWAGFNPQTITGFTAMVRMKKIVYKYFHENVELKQLADDGIFESYSTIHNKMLQYGGVVKSIHRKLLFGLLKNVPFSFIVQKFISK